VLCRRRKIRDFAVSAILLSKDITVKTHKGLIIKFGLEFVNKGKEVESVIEDAKKFLERIKDAIDELSR